MYEIYRLWQKSQEDLRAMAWHVVPIVLPDIRVADFRDRLPYLEYWADQAESLETLVRNPKIRPSRESWEEVRVIRQFADHVDSILIFLKDVLMPRQLDVHFEGDFQAVREALRRRMEAEEPGPTGR
jgi:hypothetical protein